MRTAGPHLALRVGPAWHLFTHIEFRCRWRAYTENATMMQALMRDVDLLATQNGDIVGVLRPNRLATGQHFGSPGA